MRQRFCNIRCRSRMWVVQYLQYPEPAGIKPLSRDNFWRIVYDRLPKPPGKMCLVRTVSPSMKTKRHRASIAKSAILCRASILRPPSCQTSRGAWILQPPYLLFYQIQSRFEGGW